MIPYYSLVRTHFELLGKEGDLCVKYMGGHKGKLDTKINGFQNLAYLCGINKLHKINNKCPG